MCNINQCLSKFYFQDSVLYFQDFSGQWKGIPKLSMELSWGKVGISFATGCSSHFRHSRHRRENFNTTYVLRANIIVWSSGMVKKHLMPFTLDYASTYRRPARQFLHALFCIIIMAMVLKVPILDSCNEDQNREMDLPVNYQLHDLVFSQNSINSIFKKGSIHPHVRWVTMYIKIT